MKAFILSIVGIISLPFLVVGLYEAYQNKVELDRSVFAHGTVTGNVYSTTNVDGNVSGAYHPRVEFTDAAGEKRSFTDAVGSLPADYDAGARVTVVYLAESTEKARLYSRKRFWLAPAILIAVGILPVAVFFVLMRRLNF